MLVVMNFRAVSALQIRNRHTDVMYGVTQPLRQIKRLGDRIDMV